MELTERAEQTAQMRLRESVKTSRRRYRQATKAVEQAESPQGTMAHNRLQSVVTLWSMDIYPFIKHAFDDRPEAARIWQEEEFAGHTLEELGSPEIVSATVTDNPLDVDELLRAGEAMERFFIRFLDLPDQPPVVDAYEPPEKTDYPEEIVEQMESYGYSEADE